MKTETEKQAAESKPDGYELTLNGVQKLVAGKNGFPPLYLQSYLRNGFVLNPLYKR